MKTLYLFLTIVLLNVDCGSVQNQIGQTQVPTPSVYTPFSQIDFTKIFSNQNFIYKNDAVPFNGKRLYYIHGCLGCDHLTGLMDTPAYAALAYELNAQGWQVIEFDLPVFNPNYFADGGAAYAQAYANKLNQAMAWADLNYGQASVNVIGGISYGSIHTMMGVALLNKDFNGWFGVLAFTHLNDLDEMSDVYAPFFDPSQAQATKTLASIPGYLVWNTTDDRVGDTDAINLFNNLTLMNANIQNHVYTEGGHTIDNGNLDYIYSWLINNF